MTAAQTGRRGEQAVAEHLHREGFELLSLNWRSGCYELDIVARRYDVLHFVEVKTRRAGSLTPPEAAATRQKFRALQRAATRYLESTPWPGDVQFDLACVEIGAQGIARVELIERAMEFHW